MLICLSDQTYRLETPTNTNDLLLVEMLSTVNHMQKSYVLTKGTRYFVLCDTYCHLLLLRF